MLGGFFRFRFDIKLSAKTDLLFIVNSHMEKFRQMVQLPTHVGIQKRLVTFAASPKDITGSVQFLGHLNGLSHLGRRESEDIGITGRTSSMQVTRM